jgi:hypothetical protein
LRQSWEEAALARTKNLLEEKFLLLCERHSLTPPDVNVRVAGWLVDAVWFDQNVAVELDGRAAHDTPTEESKTTAET